MVLATRVELITIGDELMLGHTVDTNGAHLARELAAIGVTVSRRSAVGDDAQQIVDAVREALDRTGAVITTGGLGPTSDDMTKPAISALFGRPLLLDERLWDGLRRLWQERGRSGEIPEANRQQVMIPEGATVLTNRHGTAPGIWLEDDRGRWCAMLPGVPREMRLMLAEELLPRMRARYGGPARVIRSRTLRTTGLPESRLPELLGPYAREVDGMSVAYLPGPDGVDLRLTSRDGTPDEADRALTAAAAKVRERLARYAYGEDGTDLASVVLALCRERALRIAVAESCTGGLLGARLTAIPGSSDVVLGGVIAYANEVKQKLLGVSTGALDRFGAVSEEVARQMAGGVRARLASEIGIAITGVAGPAGGTPEKPVGLVWIAADIRGDVRVHGGRFVGDRGEIRYRATQAALELMRRALLS